MGESLNILFLGGAKRVSMAEKLVEAGKAMGLEVQLYSYELDPYVPIASLATVIIGLKWNDPGLMDDLKNRISQYHIGMVLPFVDPAIRVAALLSGLTPQVFIPVSPKTTCDLMYDKIQADHWFTAQGIAVPPHEGSYPRIAKPRFGSASQGIIILHHEADLATFRREHASEEYLIQQYLKADEYSVDGYVDPDGRIIALVPRKRLEVHGGEATKSITVREPAVLRLCGNILQTGIFRGPLTLQFLKEQDTGKVFIMEINPRLGGGVLTSMAAGADMAAYLVNDFLHRPNEPMDNWKEQVIMTRAFREFYFYADNH
ncbi:MAG TPA: ATP-grasp domain-containing protein [Chitinophagaceae bacterium]|nr:ATP-grasp domain-containing protein [Chitinophagaceae bacterium]